VKSNLEMDLSKPNLQILHAKENYARLFAKTAGKNSHNFFSRQKCFFLNKIIIICKNYKHIFCPSPKRLLLSFTDIDDIEDFELDDGTLVEDLLHDDFEEGDDDERLTMGNVGSIDTVGLVAVSAACGATVDMVKMAAPIERERKRGSFLKTSPDLAYCSISPSSGDF
jgi:hypothetical protein